MPNWLSGLGSSRGELPCHCIFLILLCPFLLSSVASKMVLHSCGHSLMRQPRAERTFLMLLSTILMGRMGINAASRRRKTKRTKTPTARTKFDSFQNHLGNSVLETSTDCDRISRYDINFHLISMGTHARMHGEAMLYFFTQMSQKIRLLCYALYAADTKKFEHSRVSSRGKNPKWDWKGLNTQTESNGWPLLNVRQIIDRLGTKKATFFAVIDLTQGYW